MVVVVSREGNTVGKLVGYCVGDFVLVDDGKFVGLDVGLCDEINVSVVDGEPEMIVLIDGFELGPKVGDWVGCLVLRILGDCVK